MATIELNQAVWTDYDWSDSGEIWAGAWGGSRMMWQGTILPRLYRFLPTGRVLEIAPGFGRVTQYLVQCATEIVGVDVTERCVEGCRKRFANNPNVRIELNDGKSLRTIADASIDFVFSWDSLVHADRDVLEAYVHEAARVMKPGTTGFIHHSNLGAYVAACGQLPIANPHFRDTTMTAALFREFCERAGLHCVSQELVSWSQEPVLNDCFSLFRKDATQPRAETAIIERPDFTSTEMYRLGEVGRHYAR
jgi:ubiquinone/menaquinone biosynthesis C-methylase UbiE